MKKKYYFSVIIGFFLILGLSTVSAQEQHNETDEDNNGWSDETCLDYPELCNGDPVDLEEIIVTEDCYTCACDPFWCDPEPDPQPCSTCECDEFYCDPDPCPEGYDDCGVCNGNNDCETEETCNKTCDSATQILDTDTCQCKNNPIKKWYTDSDGDGWHGDTDEAINSPGSGWKQGVSKGKDCDDNNVNFTDNCGECENPNFQCKPGEILDGNCNCIIDLNDPCSNKDLRNKKVSPDVVSLINSRTQPNTMVQSSEMVKSFILETVDDGWGDLNQDKYSINISNLPNGYTPFQLFDEMRSNFDDLMVGGNIPYLTDVNLEPYSAADGVTWDSDNPVGAAMNFHTMFDTSTVYCVEYNAEEMYWIFATVTSYDHQGHFVAGLRQFGLESNANGGHSFYLRAADRLGGVLDYIANGLSGDEEALFTHAGDATWKNFMENAVGFVQRIGGYADEFDSDKTYGKRHPYNSGDCP